MTNTGHMSLESMFQIVRAQLATDLNCMPSHFDGEGFVFREAADNPGRRPFPRGAEHFEMLTMGKAVIVSATPRILAYVHGELDGKNRDDAFAMPFVCGQGLYYLPDPARLVPLQAPGGYGLEWVERGDMARAYEHRGFHNAVAYDPAHPRPDCIALLAWRDGVVAGMAGASEDCGSMWQVGIDVLPEHRGGGLAAFLVNALTIEILRRGIVPYYGTSSANIPSQRVAHRAGYLPAWVCAYKGRFEDIKTLPSG